MLGIALSAIVALGAMSRPAVAQNSEGRGPGTLFSWNNQDGAWREPRSLDEPLESDRPDFTEASNTVGRGVTQLEFGYTYTYDENDTGNSKNQSYPETLLRVGMFAEWFEFRLAWNHSQAFSIDGGAEDFQIGAEDLYLGAKIGLTPQDGIRPEMAIVPQMLLPTGNGDANEDVQPGVNWLYGWDIDDRFSTAGSTQINRAIDEQSLDSYVEFAQSWTFGTSLTEKLGNYAEFFFLVPCSADSAHTESYFDTGFTYSVTNNLQLDIRGGWGLNEAAADYFTGAGAVIRH